jgi:hypothetical protein
MRLVSGRSLGDKIIKTVWHIFDLPNLKIAKEL